MPPDPVMRALMKKTLAEWARRQVRSAELRLCLDPNHVRCTRAQYRERIAQRNLAEGFGHELAYRNAEHTCAYMEGQGWTWPVFVWARGAGRGPWKKLRGPGRFALRLLLMRIANWIIDRVLELFAVLGLARRSRRA